MNVKTEGQRVFSVGDEVVPAEDFREQFKAEDAKKKMFVKKLSYGTVAKDATWVDLVDERGKEIVGPHGNVSFSTLWVERLEPKLAA